MKDFYITNKDFKAYVDKYAVSRNISVGEAFTHAIVKEMYLFYKEREVNYVSS